MRSYFMVSLVLCALFMFNRQIVSAHEPTGAHAIDPLHQAMQDNGIEFDFGVTNVYQKNLKGGVSTHDHAGEFSGSYDLGMRVDLEQMFDLTGLLHLHAEGGWTDEGGIDTETLGESTFGVNADALGNRSFDIVELFYEVALTDQLTVFAGKIDTTAFFDASAYANDETSQFLNGALVNNPTIPFPDYGLGIVVAYDFGNDWSVIAGVADTPGDSRSTGFESTFDGTKDYFYTIEANYTTEFGSTTAGLEGTYRVGLWHDPKPKTYTGGSAEETGDMGLYLSFDQMLVKENNNPEDSQGTGIFVRYGYADQDTNDLAQFVSFGLQSMGLIDGRDNDVCGIGIAHGDFSNNASVTYDKGVEGVIETYYNAEIRPNIHVSPSLQYVMNAGGVSTTSDAVVGGLRVQIDF